VTPVVSHEEEHAIGFVGALRIPGVIEFSMCLFFAKLVSYTFLYWLPNYISSKSHVDAEESAILSTVFDWGEFFILKQRKAFILLILIYFLIRRVIDFSIFGYLQIWRRQGAYLLHGMHREGKPG
jgi:hypothetical protein